MIAGAVAIDRTSENLVRTLNGKCDKIELLLLSIPHLLAALLHNRLHVVFSI